MSRLRSFLSDVVARTGEAAHDAVNAVNDTEHSTLQAGLDFAAEHGVISQDTEQGVLHAHEALEGVRDGLTDVAVNLGEVGLAGPLAPMVMGQQMGDAMVHAYQREGGGADGVQAAVNAVNPI